MGLPKLRFLQQGHTCNYCEAVDGVTFRRPPRVEPRLVWISCSCGKKHYACHACVRTIGTLSDGNGKRLIAACAKGYSKEKEGAPS